MKQAETTGKVSLALANALPRTKKKARGSGALKSERLVRSRANGELPRADFWGGPSKALSFCTSPPVAQFPYAAAPVVRPQNHWICPKVPKENTPIWAKSSTLSGTSSETQVPPVPSWTCQSGPSACAAPSPARPNGEEGARAPRGRVVWLPRCPLSRTPHSGTTWIQPGFLERL